MSDPGVEKPSKRGLSTFLAEHEDCGGGFEVQRREGSSGSIVRVICGRCGKSIEYPAASDEELIVDQPAFRNPSQRMTRRKRGAERPPSRDEKGARRGAARTKEGEPRRRDTGVRSISWSSWLPGLIAGLIGGALVLIVIAIASGGGDSDHGSAPGGESANSRTPTAPPSSAPTPTAPAPQRQSRPSHEVTRLDQRRLADRVSIGVPRGWSAGVEGGAVTLLAGNGRAEVQVYYESGEQSVDELSRASKTFLLQRHPGGHVADVGPSDTGGRRQARSVRVTYATGTETATVLVADGYSYLILQRLGKPSSPEARRTTDAVAMSFRPV